MHNVLVDNCDGYFFRLETNHINKDLTITGQFTVLSAPS